MYFRFDRLYSSAVRHRQLNSDHLRHARQIIIDRRIPEHVTELAAHRHSFSIDDHLFNFQFVRRRRYVYVAAKCPKDRRFPRRIAAVGVQFRQRPHLPTVDAVDVIFLPASFLKGLTFVNNFMSEYFCFDVRHQLLCFGAAAR